MNNKPIYCLSNGYVFVVHGPWLFRVRIGTANLCNCYLLAGRWKLIHNGQQALLNIRQAFEFQSLQFPIQKIGSVIRSLDWIDFTNVSSVDHVYLASARHMASSVSCTVTILR